jgi:hypothetical protein
MGTTLTYINNLKLSPPQYYLIRSPTPVQEAPWYGAQEVKITNNDIEITENPLNTPYTIMLSRYYFSERSMILAWIRLTAIRIGVNYIDPERQGASCFHTEEGTLQEKYDKAVLNNYIFSLYNPNPPAPPLPPTKGGRRNQTRRLLRTKRTTRKKIGKGRFRKI